MKKKAFYYSHRFGKWMRKYHSGRSMIEMLGVLAIIGVLSIGGLYAYRQAMIRHQANQLMDFVSHVYFIFAEQCFGGQNCPFKNPLTVDITEANYQLICAGNDSAYCGPKVSKNSGYRYINGIPNISWAFGVPDTGDIGQLFFKNISEDFCMRLVENKSLKAISYIIAGRHLFDSTSSFEDFKAACKKQETYSSPMIIDWRVQGR